jgi:hypothetical protein
MASYGPKAHWDSDEEAANEILEKWAIAEDEGQATEKRLALLLGLSLRSTRRWLGPQRTNLGYPPNRRNAHAGGGAE